jgi:hypothetical protein
MHLKNEIIQKIYKFQKSRSGKTIYNKKLIGVMVAGLDPSDEKAVTVGYSLCNKRDKWDHPVIEGIRVSVPGFGKKLATQRALEWKNGTAHQLPPSIYKQFVKFTNRCRKYYKGATLPMWTLMPERQDTVNEGKTIPVQTDNGVVHCRAVENAKC